MASSSGLTSSEFSPEAHLTTIPISSPAKGLTQPSNTDTITSTIDPLAKPFSIHKHLLVSQSPYFSFRLATRVATNVVALHIPELDPDVFSFVVEYLYTGTINHEAFTTLSPSNVIEDAIHALINPWKTASTLSIPPLQNLVMAQLHRAFNAEHASAQHAILWNSHNEDSDSYQYHLLQYVRECCEGTKDGCSLRRWISDLYACGLAKTKRGRVDKNAFGQHCSKDFLMDVLWRVDNLRWDLRNEEDESDDFYSFEEFRDELDDAAAAVPEVGVAVKLEDV